MFSVRAVSHCVRTGGLHVFVDDVDVGCVSTCFPGIVSPTATDVAATTELLLTRHNDAVARLLVRMSGPRLASLSRCGARFGTWCRVSESTRHLDVRAWPAGGARDAALIASALLESAGDDGRVLLQAGSVANSAYRVLCACVDIQFFFVAADADGDADADGIIEREIAGWPAGGPARKIGEALLRTPPCRMRRVALKACGDLPMIAT